MEIHLSLSPKELTNQQQLIKPHSFQFVNQNHLKVKKLYKSILQRKQKPSLLEQSLTYHKMLFQKFSNHFLRLMFFHTKSLLFQQLQSESMISSTFQSPTKLLSLLLSKMSNTFQSDLPQKLQKSIVQLFQRQQIRLIHSQSEKIHIFHYQLSQKYSLQYSATRRFQSTTKL